jgi:hypothetical protein
LLKPIIKVPKVVVTFAALFKFVEIAEAIVVLRVAAFRSILYWICCVLRKVVCFVRRVSLGGVVIVV